MHSAPVTAPPDERTGLLVIRAWIEANGESRLCARITRTADVNRRGEVSTVAATPGQIVGTVEDWIDSFLRGGS